MKVRTEAAVLLPSPRQLNQDKSILFITDLGPGPSFTLMRILVWTGWALLTHFLLLSPKPSLGINLWGQGRGLSELISQAPEVLRNLGSQSCGRDAGLR